VILEGGEKKKKEGGRVNGMPNLLEWEGDSLSQKEEKEENGHQTSSRFRHPFYYPQKGEKKKGMVLARANITSLKMKKEGRGERESFCRKVAFGRCVQGGGGGFFFFWGLQRSEIKKEKKGRRVKGLEGRKVEFLLMWGSKGGGKKKNKSNLLHLIWLRGMFLEFEKEKRGEEMVSL